MKIFLFKTSIALFSLLLCATASAVNYPYTELILKDYDQMNSQVQARIKKARAIPDKDEDGSRAAVEILRDAMKLIFSRPNTDNMVAKLTPEVRRELTAYSAYEDTIASIAAEELGLAKDPNGTVIQRGSAVFVLENILSEIRAEAANNVDFRKTIQRIADAKLKLAYDVVKERKSRSMFNTKSPSDIAQEILKGLPKTEKKN